MKKQTAVEYLLEQMGLEQLIFPKDIIDKGKEMERQQRIDAFEQGEYTGRGFEDLTSEEYYNINFKSK
jgi:hypothetical protein